VPRRTPSSNEAAPAGATKAAPVAPYWPAELEELASELPRRVSGLARMLYGASGSTLPRGMRSVLFALSAGPLRISQVAGQEGVGQSAATRMVARLEATGLVRRERSATDGRVMMVSVTDRGRAELEYMREQSRSVMRDVLRGCSARDLRRLSQASDALELLINLIQSLPASEEPRRTQSTQAVSSRRNTRRALPSSTAVKGPRTE
jgi:DNA-binding MarR family transcriptional regulator